MLGWLFGVSVRGRVVVLALCLLLIAQRSIEFLER